ncbi:MAG: hypothetical protein RBT69_05495 [Spirochaetia bacterium]|jgi:hypothetical protein|nr:hypothetical protein [Spirochaetia bacterium]
MKKITILVILIVFSAMALYAADLAVYSQVNLYEQDYANNYFTFRGSNNANEKDSFDAVAGASKGHTTELFNSYRRDVKGNPTMPVGLRSLFLYSVASNATMTGDNLTAVQANDGTITIRYVHRGTAYEIVTDKAGKLSLPKGNYRMRKIGHTDNTIHPDFSSTGKAANVDWNKVWNTSIADGKQVASTPAKTGKVLNDYATSEYFQFAGTLQAKIEGKFLKVYGELDAVK